MYSIMTFEGVYLDCERILWRQKNVHIEKEGIGIFNHLNLSSALFPFFSAGYATHLRSV